MHRTALLLHICQRPQGGGQAHAHRSRAKGGRAAPHARGQRKEWEVRWWGAPGVVRCAGACVCVVVRRVDRVCVTNAEFDAML